MRPKTFRRLILLSVAGVVLLAAAVGLVVVRRWQHDHTLQRRRAEGMSAAAAGNYVAGINHLGAYLRARSHRADDREALLAYADCRERIEESDGRQFRDAALVLQRCLGMDPADRATGKHLLRLFNKAGLYHEARDLAPRLRPADLAKAGTEDLDVLREEIVALLALRTPEEELGGIIQRTQQLAPTDFSANWLLVAWLYFQKETEAARRHLDALAGTYPDDPGVQLVVILGNQLMAGAHGAQAEQDHHLNALCEIAGLDPATGRVVGAPAKLDSESALRLVASFDAMRKHTHALGVLRQMTPAIGTTDMLRIYARRAWQAGVPSELVKALADIDLGPGTDEGGPGAHTELLAFKGMALIDLGRTSEAETIIAALEQRRVDFRAKGWVPALRARLAIATPTGMPPSNSELLDAVKSAQAALKEHRTEPVFSCILGQCLAALGRRDEARAALTAAADSPLSAGWEAPSILLSQVYLQDGRIDDAVKAATRAVEIAPLSVAGTQAYVVARVAELEAGQTPKVDQAMLLARFESAAERLGSAADAPTARRLTLLMLPGRVILLARLGRTEDARRLIEGAVMDRATPVDVLQRLAIVCAREGLGHEAQCLDAAGLAARTPGERAAVTLARARLLAAGGKKDEGTALLVEGARKETPEDQREWRLAMARYLDSVGDSTALAAWKGLIAEFPDDVALKQAVLLSASAAADLAFVEQVSTQLAMLTGADDIRPALVSRLARARALVQGPPSVRSRDEAISILRALVIDAPDLLPVRMLLARALLIEDGEAGIVPDLASAIEQLRAATVLAPDNGAVAMQLARLLIRRGDVTLANTELQRIAGDTGAGLELRLEAVDTLMAQAQFGLAGTSLEALARQLGDAAPTGVRLRLAEALARQSRDADALAIYRAMAQSLPRDPEEVLRLADGLAFLSDPSSAEAVVGTAERQGVSPGVARLLRARFEERHGSPEVARRAFEEAVELAPGNPAAWSAFAGFLLSQGDRAAALVTAGKGLERVPGNAELLVVRQQAVFSALGPDERGLIPLAEAMERVPATRARAKAVRAVERLRASGLLGDPMAIASLADRFASDLTVQLFAAQRLMALEPARTVESASIVRRISSSFPVTVDTARIAALVYRAIGDWQAAGDAAGLWAQLSRSCEADLVIAESRLARSDPVGALEKIRPRVQRASVSVEDRPSQRVLEVYARALIGSGRQTEAAEALAPLLSRSAGLRTQVWLPLAGSVVRPESEARAWIARVEPQLVGTSVDEQRALAAAWMALAMRFGANRAELAGKAVEVLRAQGARPDGATVEVLVDLAEALQLGGDAFGAVEVLRRAAQAEPGSLDLQVRLATAVVEADRDPEEAWAAMERVRSAHPVASLARDGAMGRAYQMLAKKYAGAGNGDRARQAARHAAECYGRIRASEPDDLAACLGLAVVSECLGDFGTMAEMYDRALASGALGSPEEGAAMKNNLAYALSRQGKDRQILERARRLVLEAIEADPVGAFYDTLGNVETALGNRAAALGAFRKAVQLDGGSVAPRVALVSILSRGDGADKQEATALLAEIDARTNAAPKLSDEQQKRLLESRAVLTPR